MNPTFRVSSGLIDPKHKKAMGPALWVFEWCIDRQTDEEGNVMYGRSLKISRIAGAIGSSLPTARRYVSRLVKSGYLSVKRTGHGVSIRVLNQKKWRHPSDQKRSLARVITQSDQKRSLGTDRECSKTITRIKNGRARDLHLKTATTTEREVFTPATPMDPAAALCVRNPEGLEAPAVAYYSAQDLALMPARTRALVERLAAPDYDPILAGDCRRCHTGPRAIGELCVDCAPRLVRPALREVHA